MNADAPRTHFFDLPVELQAIILKDGDDLDSVIRRWVCRAWRKILPINKRACKLQSLFCAKVAGLGSLSLLKWARANGCPWGPRTCANAVRREDMEMLLWARENGCVWDSGSTTAAVELGSLELLQWLRARDCPWDVTTTRTAWRTNITILQWAIENGCPLPYYCTWLAGELGSVEVLQLLCNRGHPPDLHCARAAAKNGNIDALIWMSEHGVTLPGFDLNQEGQ